MMGIDLFAMNRNVLGSSSDSMAFRLPAEIVEEMRREITGVAEQVIAAIVSEVPSYRDPFRGRMGRNIQMAVRVALDGFLELASRAEGIDAGDQIATVRDAAYELGRGEARSGRSMDALAAAYRLGARISWREMSSSAVAAGLPADQLARFAELVFAYIDELSAVSVAGHADELASSGRLQQRRRDRLALRLLEGAAEADLLTTAERADWVPPQSLTALSLTESRARALRGRLDPGTLHVPEDAPGQVPNRVIFLVPTGGTRDRTLLLRLVGGTEAIAGPARPWHRVRESAERVYRAATLGLEGDTERHLATLILAADGEARDDLRARLLEPLAGLTATSREKLTETLRAWLLHQGRRDEVAAALFVHPQTVRYRMTQLRQLYGDRLGDPEFVRDAVIALG